MFRAQRQEEQEKQRRNSAASRCRSGGVTLGTCKQSFLYFHKRLTQKASCKNSRAICRQRACGNRGRRRMLTKAWSAAKLVIAMRANLLAWDVPLAAETLVTTFLRILSTSSIWKSSCCTPRVTTFLGCARGAGSPGFVPRRHRGERV